MLANARSRQPQLKPLLIDREIFNAMGSTLAVNESRPAGEQPPEGLAAPEKDLYRHLHKLEKDVSSRSSCLGSGSRRRWRIGMRSIEARTVGSAVRKFDLIFRSRLACGSGLHAATRTTRLCRFSKFGAEPSHIDARKAVPDYRWAKCRQAGHGAAALRGRSDQARRWRACHTKRVRTKTPAARRGTRRQRRFGSGNPTKHGRIPGQRRIRSNAAGL
jgi:hypothetical protein